MSSFGFYCFIFLCLISKAQSSNLILQDMRVESDFNPVLTHLIKTISKQEKVENILLIFVKPYKSQRLNCALENLLEKADLPFMVQSLEVLNDTDNEFLSNVYAQQTLIFICAPRLRTFVHAMNTRTIQHIHKNRFVIFVEQKAVPTTTVLRRFCEQCFKQDTFNVLFFNSKVLSDGMYFRCQKYPHVKSLYVRKPLNETLEVFPNQFLNMQGDDIKTQPKNLVPYCFRGIDKSGKSMLLGYMAKVITNYAERRNATLKFSMEGASLTQVGQAVRFGSLDLAIIPYYQPFVPLNQTSYTYTVDKVCFLIPLQGYIPINIIFYTIIKYQTLFILLLLIAVYDFLLKYSIKAYEVKFNWFNYWLNDKCLRLMLGQSFPFPTKLSLNACFVCLQVFVFSVWINTAYQAFLQSWLTQTPFLPRLKSADELEAFNLRVITLHWPYNEYLLGPIKRTNPNLIKYVDDHEQLAEYYYNFDTRYSYPIAMTHWLALNEQQQYFQKQLFYYSDTLCASQIELLRFPLRSRLPYKELFDMFLLNVHDSGLYRLWLRQNFYDMVRLNLTTFEDFSSPVQFGGPLMINDMSFIFWGYIGFMVASIFVLFTEIFISNIEILHAFKWQAK